MFEVFLAIQLSQTQMKCEMMSVYELPPSEDKFKTVLGHDLFISILFASVFEIVTGGTCLFPYGLSLRAFLFASASFCLDWDADTERICSLLHPVLPVQCTARPYYLCLAGYAWLTSAEIRPCQFLWSYWSLHF